MSKIPTLFLMTLLLTSNQLHASEGKYCWEEDRLDSTNITNGINHSRGFKLQKLTIDTSDGGYIQIPKIYNNWFMNTGFDLKFSNKQVTLIPLKITPDKKLTSSSTVINNNVWVSVDGDKCNAAHECSLSVTLTFKMKVEVGNNPETYAEITFDIRRHKGIRFYSEDGVIKIKTINNECPG